MADTLVRDIHLGTYGTSVSSSPTVLAEVDGTVYFSAIRSDIGTELWRTDGTSAGTKLVKDINPGVSGSFPTQGARLSDGRVVFAALRDDTGSELFVTDGTADGTMLVMDVFPGATSSTPDRLIAHLGRVWFFANDGVHGRELWVTNGSLSGTMLVKDQAPGTNNGMFGARLMSEGGNLFVAHSSSLVAGTDLSLVSAIFPPKLTLLDTTATLQPSEFFSFHTSIGGVALFIRRDQVWRSDGTKAGTFQLAVVPVGMWLVASGGRAYFGSFVAGLGVELMTTDGTVAGTVVVKDINPGGASSILSSFPAFPYRDGILFTGTAGLSKGMELFYSDGTAPRTNLVIDLWPGSESSKARAVASWHDDIFVLGAAPGLGTELYRLRGWPGPPTPLLIKDLTPGAGSSPYDEIAIAEHGIFFRHGSNSGVEPWVTDGTSAGTFELVNINEEPLTKPSDPRELTRFGNHLFFSATDGVVGRELWRSDGTTEGTTLFADLFPGQGESSPGDLLLHDGYLYFAAEVPGVGRELFRTDGSVAGIELVSDLAGVSSTSPRGMTSVGDKIYFSGWGGSAVGRELFVTDGTLAGTSLVADASTSVVSVSTTVTSPFGLRALDDKVFFLHANLSTGLEPWISDGTAGGTMLLRDINQGPLDSVDFSTASQVFEAVVFKGRVYFAATTSAEGLELWSTDGTPAGTSLVIDLMPGSSGSDPKQLTLVGDHLLFVATSSAVGREVWRTDGTAAGTVAIDVVSGPISTDPVSLTSLGDVALFGSVDNDVPVLLRTDGFAPVVVKKLSSGIPGPSFLRPVTRLGQGEHALFGAAAVGTGSELWFTDLTDNGTIQLTEIASGKVGSDPMMGVQVGDRYLFAADDYLHGNELHAINLVDTSAWVAHPVGEGCEGVGGEFSLTAQGKGVTGAMFGIAVEHASPNAPVLLFASNATAGPILPVACGPKLASLVAIAMFPADAQGSVSKLAPLPSNPALAGSLFYLQVASPLSGGPYQGVATFSAPLEVVINTP